MPSHAKKLGTRVAEILVLLEPHADSANGMST
jgi:hypothetical protein